MEKSTGCKPHVSSQALLCWREQKAPSRDFVLSKKYFLAGIRWAYDRLLFLHVPQWTDANLHGCICRSKRAWCTLSFSWLTVTLGPQVVADGSKVNWFGEGCLQGLDWEAEDPVSVLHKVQSCVTYWHTHVCLEYHWVLCGVLKKTNLLSMKKNSPCLVLCSQPELDEYSHGKNTSGMQHQQRCLASCIHWFFLIVVCFFIQSPEPRWQPSSRLRMQTIMLCTLLVHGYVTNAHGTHGFCFASELLVCVSCVCCCGKAGGLRCAFSPPAETCQSPWGAGSRFTGQLRQPWQPGSSRLEQGMPLCRLLPGQDLFPSCHFTSTSSTFN